MVAGDFVRGGGMDRANAEMAAWLATSGFTVHLVGFRIEDDLAATPNVLVHKAERLAGSHSLSRYRLSHLGRTVAAKVIASDPATRVLVNGVNCEWPDINWVHFVHHRWRLKATHGPLWFRLKEQLAGRANRSREQRLLRRARIVIANSERTRSDLVQAVGLNPERVRTVYLGCGDELRPASNEQRLAARSRLGVRFDRPLVSFIGALGHDSRKGFDTLWTAWRSLCARPEWDADLVVAGGGRALAGWRREVCRSGLETRVHLLGQSERVVDVLAAADLLVSPVRYEAYGLNVQEALCSGIPAIVSADAGIAERYPAELSALLLPDPDDVQDLAGRLLRWRGEIEGWKRRVAPFGALLRAWTWRDMAARMIEVVENGDGPALGPVFAARSCEGLGSSR